VPVGSLDLSLPEQAAGLNYARLTVPADNEHLRGRSAGHHLGNDPVKLPQRFLTGLGVLGLAITTAISAMPAPAAFADPLPDVAVTYTGFNYGANGMLDVAFGITSNGAAASMTLNTTCIYHKISDNSTTRTEKGKIGLSIPQG